MSHIEHELDYAFGSHYRQITGFKAEPHCITLCGHIDAILEVQDAYCIYLPRYDFSVQICEDCYTKIQGIYTVGSDWEWEEKIQQRYDHFKFNTHSYIWFGTLEQLQITLQEIRKR